MIAERIIGDSATTEEFATYFLKSTAIFEDEADLEAMALEIADIVRRNVDVEEVKILGRGSFGAAGRIPGTRKTLKLTTDRREVHAASSIKGIRFRHVARIYEVGFVRDLEIVSPLSWTAHPVGLVVQDFVDRIGLGKKADNEALFDVVYYAKVRFRISPRFLDELPEDQATSLVEKASMAIAESLERKGEPFNQIAKGLRELQRVGVFIADPHAKNVGWDKETERFKIFDLGLSAVREARAPVLSGPSMGASSFPVRNRNEVNPACRADFDDAVERALKAGAVPPLTYLGCGMTGIVFCDDNMGGWKVARATTEKGVPELAPISRELLLDEYEFLKAAGKSSMADHVVRVTSWHPEEAVIERECVVGFPGGWGDGRELRKLHIDLEHVMMPTKGWTSPEFKEDSYVRRESDGKWVLVDATFPQRIGGTLVRWVEDVLAGRRETRTSPSTMAFLLRREIPYGTISKEEVDRLVRQLKEAFPKAEGVDG